MIVKTLEKITTTTTPGSAAGPRNQEIHMKKLVRMEELALRVHAGSSEHYWGMIRPLMRANSAKGSKV